MGGIGRVRRIRRQWRRHRTRGVAIRTARHVRIIVGVQPAAMRGRFAYHLHRLQKRAAQAGKFTRRSETVLAMPAAMILPIVLLTDRLGHRAEGFGRIPQRMLQISPRSHRSARRSRAPVISGRQQCRTQLRGMTAIGT